MRRRRRGARAAVPGISGSPAVTGRAPVPSVCQCRWQVGRVTGTAGGPSVAKASRGELEVYSAARRLRECRTVFSESDWSLTRHRAGPVITIARGVQCCNLGSAECRFGRLDGSLTGCACDTLAGARPGRVPGGPPSYESIHPDGCAAGWIFQDEAVTRRVLLRRRFAPPRSQSAKSMLNLGPAQAHRPPKRAFWW